MTIKGPRFGKKREGNRKPFLVLEKNTFKKVFVILFLSYL